MRQENYGPYPGRSGRDQRNNYSPENHNRYSYQDDYQNPPPNWNQRGANEGGQREYPAPHRNMRPARTHEDDHRNFFQSAGETIRATWNDLTDRDKWHDDGYYHDQHGRSDREYSRSNGNYAVNQQAQGSYPSTERQYKTVSNSYYNQEPTSDPYSSANNQHNDRTLRENEYNSTGRGSYTSRGRGSYSSGGQSSNGHQENREHSSHSQRSYPGRGQERQAADDNRNGNYNDAYTRPSGRYGDDEQQRSDWDSNHQDSRYDNGQYSGGNENRRRNRQSEPPNGY